MAIAPVRLYDSFSRTLSGGAWGTTDTGQAWSSFGPVNSSGVTTGYGYIDVAKGQGLGYKWNNYDTVSPPLPKQDNTEVLVRMQWSGTDPWPRTDTGPIINRHPTESTFYYASLQGYYAEASVGVSIKGYRYELARKAITLKKGVWYWVRFRRDGRIKLKIWADGTLEPSSWLIDTLQWTGNNPPTTGSSGFFVRGTTFAYQVRVSDYYMYTLQDAHPTTLPYDTFTRTVTDNFGVSTSGHLWEGSVSSDPAVRKYRSTQTITVASTYGQIQTTDGPRRTGYLGQTLSGNYEAYTEFEASTSPSNYFRLGICGTQSIINGESVANNGYYLQMVPGSAGITLYKRVAGVETSIGTYTLSAAILTNTKYRAKLQIVGTSIRAKAWLASAAEPNIQITVTDTAFSSGKLWIEFDQVDASVATRYVRIHDIRIQGVTPDSAQPVNKSILGQLVQTGSTDTTISLELPYSGDADNDLSYYRVDYKKPTENTYIQATLSAQTIDRTARKATATVSGLQQATEYDIWFRMTDSYGIEQSTGTTATGRFSTTANGVRASTITASATSSTTATVSATYKYDNNNTSTATLYRRETSRQVNVLEDTFNEIDGIYLQNHRVGGEEVWTKHPLTTTERQAVIYNQQLRSGALDATDTVLYYVTATSPTEEYDVVADAFVPNIEGTIAILGRLSTTLLTAYGVWYNGAARQWELVRYNNGVATVLDTYSFEILTPTVHNVKLVIRDAYKAVELDNVEIMRSTDNTIAAGKAGYYATGIRDGNAERYIFLDNFKQTYRIPNTAWVSVGAMTANRTTKTFSYSVTGLTVDTVYDFRVDFADADGVYGAQSLYSTVMTFGQAVLLEAVGAATQATSAVVDILYDYDSNENSTVSVSYRSTRSLLWIPVNQIKVIADRTAKRFTTTLVGLRPATTYELRVLVSDPNGLIEGSPRELSGLFTTKGVIEQIQKRTKHYLWKVYTPNGKYLGTLENVGDPEYTWQANGGVTDLSARILEPIASTVSGRNPIVAHQNRVDVWVLDPSSDGLGPNMVKNGECDSSVGGWTLGTNWSYSATGGPDGSSSLKFAQSGSSSEYETESVPVYIKQPVPLVISAVARATGGKLSMYVMAFNRTEQQIDTSEEQAETVGSDWQHLKINYRPPKDTHYVRVIFRNRGAGTMWVDKVEMKAKEALIYRGMIESYTPTVDQDSQYTDIQILGLVSLLSDDYVEFLQYVRTQPQKDVLANRPNRGPADPATIMQDLVDIARQQNPRCSLYYTEDSIKPTGTVVEYTFRDQQLRACFDKVRGLCPPDWHYFIDPDGLVNLRGPEHVTTHVLKANVHIMNFSIERSIRGLKNYVRIKGRQDEDKNEPDGFGSINYVAFDQASIDRYGKRVLFIRDAQITTPDTAELFGDGRLEEYNREEQRAQCVVPDEKSIQSEDSMLIGYNIEAFRPGDMVKIVDPISGAKNTYWDRFVWNVDSWNAAQKYVPLPTTVPIKEIQIHGAEARIELSERQPSGVSDYGRLARWLSLQNNDE